MRSEIKLNNNLKAILCSASINKSIISKVNTKKYKNKTIENNKYGPYLLKDHSNKLVEGTDALFLDYSEIDLPDGTPLEIVLLAEPKYEKDENNEDKLILTSIEKIEIIYGIRVSEESEYFNQFKIDSFLTGVLFDITELDSNFYKTTPANHKEVRRAHELLYAKTKDLFEIPKQLCKDERVYLAMSRAGRRCKIMQPPVIIPRFLEEMTLGTVFGNP